MALSISASVDIASPPSFKGARWFRASKPQERAMLATAHGLPSVRFQRLGQCGRRRRIQHDQQTLCDAVISRGEASRSSEERYVVAGQLDRAPP